MGGQLRINYELLMAMGGQEVRTEEFFDAGFHR